MDMAVVTVGDELLAGDTEDSNATWLARELSELGVSVRRLLTVPDDVGVVADAVRKYATAFDAVVVTGGLGGTPDDVTMDGVAAAFDRPLVENALARADLKRTLSALGESYPDLDVDVASEAAIPADARPLVNDAGLSPGCVVEAEGAGTVYALPGNPGEMRDMFETVAAEFGGDVASEFLYTDEPEANLVERLDEARRRFDVAVGCYPDQEAGHSRLKVRDTDPDAVADAAAWLAEEVRTVDP